MSKQYAIVRTISTFYHEFVMPLDELQKENPDSVVEAEWLADSVVLGEVDELGQKHLGEQIISVGTVTEEQALQTFDDIIPYLKSWTREQKTEYMRNSIERLK